MVVYAVWAAGDEHALYCILVVHNEPFLVREHSLYQRGNMKFSEYVTTERAGILVDPLGFLRPSRALQNTIFKQFTVLTNRPGYHGFLCMAWKLLEDSGHPVGSANFSRKFREAEIFWGLLNAAQGTPILNINKYKSLLDDRLSLKNVRSGDAIYSRLAYGTLGHYSQPSIAWGLIETSGRMLSTQGVTLARAASVRNKLDFADWLAGWRDGKEFTREEVVDVQQAFHLLAAPSKKEQVVWQELISGWTELHPHTHALWSHPLAQEELDEADQSTQAHCAFHQELPNQYPGLKSEMQALTRFERLCGAVQFIFDMKLSALEFEISPLLPAPGRLDELASAIVELAQVNSRCNGFQPGRLFATLAAAPARYEQLEEVIISHHVSHQRNKGVSPFLEGSRLLVKGKVESKELGDVLEALADCETVNTQLDRLQYRSRRDWHFRRCRTYHDWAQGRVQGATQ